MAHLRLSIEPIPASSRLASLAKLMPRDQWDQLRRTIYRRSGYRCQVCGREGRLHCHEVWQYNERTGYQWLRGLRSLCQDCHGVKHLTFARDHSLRNRLLQHFMAVNGLSREETAQYLCEAHRRQAYINTRSWIVNFGEFNFRMPALADIRQRRDYARLTHPSYRDQPGRS